MTNEQRTWDFTDDVALEAEIRLYRTLLLGCCARMEKDGSSASKAFADVILAYLQDFAREPLEEELKIFFRASDLVEREQNGIAPIGEA